MKKKYYQEMEVAPEEEELHNPLRDDKAIKKGISNIGGLILLELNILFGITYLALGYGVLKFLTN